MTANKTIAAGALLSALLLASPLGAGQITSRTFTDPYSVGLNFGNGAGIYDPADPTNTCIALLFIDIGASMLVLFYPNGRLAIEGPVSDLPLNPEVVVGPDPTDCAGLADPGGQIGVNQGTGRTGGYAAPLPITGTVFPGTESITFDGCPYTPASGPVYVQVGDDVDCTGTRTNLFAAFNQVGAFDLGSLYLANMDLDSSGNVVVCVEALVFDVTLNAFTQQSDEDWFVAIAQEDLAAGNTAVLTAALADSAATNWSTIADGTGDCDSNGTDNELGCEAFFVNAVAPGMGVVGGKNDKPRKIYCGDLGADRQYRITNLATSTQSVVVWDRSGPRGVGGTYPPLEEDMTIPPGEDGDVSGFYIEVRGTQDGKSATIKWETI